MYEYKAKIIFQNDILNWQQSNSRLHASTIKNPSKKSQRSTGLTNRVFSLEYRVNKAAH